MASERDLTTLKARRMSREALAAEMLRCKDGMRVGSTPAARRRFKLRHDIMESELLTRLGPDRKGEP